MGLQAAAAKRGRAGGGSRWDRSAAAPSAAGPGLRLTRAFRPLAPIRAAAPTSARAGSPPPGNAASAQASRGEAAHAPRPPRTQPSARSRHGVAMSSMGVLERRAPRYWPGLRAGRAAAANQGLQRTGWGGAGRCSGCAGRSGLSQTGAPKRCRGALGLVFWTTPTPKNGGGGRPAAPHGIPPPPRARSPPAAARSVPAPRRAWGFGNGGSGGGGGGCEDFSGWILRRRRKRRRSGVCARGKAHREERRCYSRM